MTADRHRGNAPVWRAFRELAHLPPEERKEQLMIRLEHIWDEAQSKSYTNKHGDEIANPDGTLQLKVIQAVAVLEGMTGPAAEEAGAKLARMTDAELVREATKRLPPHEVAALADSLIALREQETSKQAIVTTTGESTDEQRSSTEPEPTEVDANGSDFSQSGPGWA